MKKQTILILAITLLSICFAACGAMGTANSAKPEAEKPMPVGALMNEYEKSKDATVAKYTGKTLTVRGYTLIAPLMPTGSDETGFIGIMEKGGDMLKTLSCQFAAADKDAFSRIKGDQTIIVRGVFSDDMSTKLTSCKLVEIE